MFADDCMLYLSGNNWNTMFNIVQSELDIFIDWTKQNMLRLNSSKTQAMIVGTRSKISQIKNPKHFSILGTDIKYVKKYNYLGIILDSEMSLVPLCKNIQKCVVDKIFMLRKLGKYLTNKALIQIYKQVILPIMDYAGFLIIACHKTVKHDLQILQNDVTLVNLHKKAKISSLEQQRCVQPLTLMYKLSKVDENRNISARVTRQQEKYTFRTDNRIGTKYSTSPYYKGTELWNILEKDVQFSDSIFLFKQHIKNMYNDYIDDFYI